MSEYRYVYYQKGAHKKGNKTYCCIHFLIGYNQGTLADYQSMARKLKKDVPDLKVGDVRCSSVSRSSYCFGFTIIQWHGYADLEALRKNEKFNVKCDQWHHENYFALFG